MVYYCPSCDIFLPPHEVVQTNTSEDGITIQTAHTCALCTAPVLVLRVEDEDGKSATNDKHSRKPYGFALLVLAVAGAVLLAGW